MAGKCYAWRPGHDDGICSKSADHKGSHKDYDGHKWPRVTLKQLKAARREFAEANVVMNRASWGLVALYLQDGRHDLGDRHQMAEHDEFQAWRTISRTAAGWQLELAAKAADHA